jgi:hypothetical protein
MGQIITRAGWGADAPSQPLTRVAHTRGVKVHYTGGWVDPRIVDDHRECLALMLSIQRMHMSGGRGEKYSDFGYNMAACCHRRVFIGRGPGYVPAANGAGLNTAHYAVLALVGSTGYVVPDDDLLHAILDAIDYLRTRGGAGPEIRCHRDGYATACPGDRLTAWVRRGAPRPRSTPLKSWTEDLVDNLPTLKPGDVHRHVKTMRGLLHARGYEPRNLHSMTFGYSDDDLEDLAAQVNAFKAKHKLAKDSIWGDGCWRAALS